MLWTLHTVQVSAARSFYRLIPTKLNSLYLQGKGIFPVSFEAVSFGINLHRSVSVKYFGVVLDLRLTWREQVSTQMK